MLVKTRMQGNSVSATFPKYLGVEAGVELEPTRTKEGILFKFVQDEEDEFFNFDKEILTDVIQEGYQGKEIIEEFTRRKANIPKAFQLLAEEAKTAKVMTEEEFTREYL